MSYEYQGLDDYNDAMSSAAEGDAMAEQHRYWVTTVEDNYGDFPSREFASLEDATHYAVEQSVDWEWVICVKDTQADTEYHIRILLLAHEGRCYKPIEGGK